MTNEQVDTLLQLAQLFFAGGLLAVLFLIGTELGKGGRRQGDD